MSRPAPERRATRRDRVWIVNHYASAPDRPLGSRHFDLARQLVRHGRDVTIFASSFSHFTGVDERLGGSRLYRTQVFDGVRFVWLRTFPYRGNTWRRQVNMLSFVAAFLLVQARFARPGTVIGSTVHPFAAFGAWFTARLRRAHFVFEVRDLWPQTLIDLGAMREGSAGERMLRWLESHLVRHADAVITLLPGMADYLRERGLPVDRLVYLPNGVDVGAFDAAMEGTGDPPADVGAALGLVDDLRGRGRFVIGYVGGFGHVNQLNVVVEAARLAELQCPGRVGVILVGDGPERAALESQAKAVGGVVSVGPSVPRRYVPVVLRALDAAVVHATATPVYRYGISFNKLFEYMAADRPIIFACGSAYDPVAGQGAGITVAPDDPVALAGAFLAIAGLPEQTRREMGERGHAYMLAEHNIERLGETLNELVARVTRRP